LGPADATPDSAAQRRAREQALRQEHMPQFVQFVEELLEHVQKSRLLRGRHDFLDGLYQNSRRTIENQVHDLRREFPAWPVSDSRDGERRRDFLSAPDDAYYTLIDALDSFFLRDMMVYPLMQGNDIAAELQPIHFVRISPSDAAGDGSHGELAGKSLAHFGGFLSQAWRGNDLVRGRLDAVEIILRTLLPEKEHERERQELLQKATEDIRAKMHLLNMDILRPDKQTLARIPTPDKIRWGMKGLMNTVKILRKSVADSGAAGWLQWLINPMNWASNVLSGATLLVAVLCKALSTRKSLARIAAYTTVGVVSIVLWENRHTWIGWVEHLLTVLRGGNS
jgi:hypothetical protein